MIGVILIGLLLAFIGWLHYLKNQQKQHYLQAKEAHVKDIMNRYPSAEALEKLVQSDEWTKLMEVYSTPPAGNNRLLVLLVACLGILAVCLSVASAILTFKVDDDMIYPAIMLGAIGLALLVNASIISHYLKKWKLQ